MASGEDSDTITGFRWRDGLLGPTDADPVGHERPNASSPFLLICDHAGNRMPESLGQYGLTSEDFDRHYAYDIGALSVSRAISTALDAELVYQRYSRILIDCNRPPHSAGAFVKQIDGVRIVRNESLENGHLASRITEVFHPYHSRIEAAIGRRLSEANPPVVVSVHSFTPHHSDFPDERPWHIGVLYNRDCRFASALIETLQAEPNLIVGINQPYVVDDYCDYAIPVHCERLGLLHVEIEIRQDLITSSEGQAEWGSRLATLLPTSLSNMQAMPTSDFGTAEPA